MNAVALTAFEIITAALLIFGLLNEEKVANWEHKVFRKIRRAVRRRKPTASVALVRSRSVSEKYCA